MKALKFASLLTLIALLLTLMMVSCGPAYVNTGVGYGPRPYYGYNGYRPYGYGYGYRRPVVVAPPVVVRPRYYNPAPRYYNSPNARGGGYGGGYRSGGGGGGSRSRGPR